MLGARGNLGDRADPVKTAVHLLLQFAPKFVQGREGREPRRIPPCAARSCTASRGRRSASRSLLTLLGVADDPESLTNGQALVLGIVQGLTELLPISSSAHLILVPWGADWTFLRENERFNQTFDVALHLGTLVAVAAYFWGDLVRLVRALLRLRPRRRIATADERIAWFVVVATIPAGVVGLLGEDLDRRQPREPWQILILLAAGALLLWWADRRAPDASDGRSRPRARRRHGARAGARARPGVSRSGITITAGRLHAASIATAPRASRSSSCCRPFSARVLLKGVGDVLLGDLPNGWQGPFLVGTLAALGSGLLAIDWLLGYVRRHTYDVFVLYRLVIAVIVLLMILSGVREATF